MLWEYIREKMLFHREQRIEEKDAALSFEDAVMYAEIFSEKLAGIKCCAILCRSELAAAIALLACFARGITALPLPFRYGEAHYRKILDAVSPDGIITDTGESWEVYKITDATYSPPKPTPALIMCTSGTTGKPKGIMLSEENILSNTKDIARYFDITEGDAILITRPLYHCAVLSGEFLVALTKGCQIRFYSAQLNPQENWEQIEKNGITVFCGTPTLLSFLARFKRKDLPSPLRHIAVSGEPMNAETGRHLLHAFEGAAIYHVYGLTEASPRVSYLPPELFADFPDSVGRPLHSVQVKILDENGQECPPNKEGTLWVKGKSVMLGYYRDRKRTAKALQDGWLHTGDIARMNSDGLLKILGRCDDLIIKSGMNIYPAEIEAVLKEDPRVREIFVYGFTGRFGVEIGMKIAGDFSDAKEIRALCQAKLPAFQIPSKIELLSALEKTDFGKIRRVVPPC